MAEWMAATTGPLWVGTRVAPWDVLMVASMERILVGSMADLWADLTVVYLE